MTKDEELKPCPFCGGKVRLESSHGFNYVLCKKCKSEYYPASFGDGKKVVSAWNNRPIEDLKDDENAWLEKNLKDYNCVMLENARLREALQMIATEKDNHGQRLSVEQSAQIAKDTLDGGLI